LYVIFKNPDYYTRVPEIKISAELNERQKKIIWYLAEHKKIKREEYARICKCTEITAKRDLNKLVEKKY